MIPFHGGVGGMKWEKYTTRSGFSGLNIDLDTSEHINKTCLDFEGALAYP
jgi:hypothetical protein